MCHVLLEKLPKNPLFLNYPKIAAFSRKVCCTSTDAEIRRPGRDGYLSPPQFKVSDGSPNLDLFPLCLSSMHRSILWCLKWQTDASLLNEAPRPGKHRSSLQHLCNCLNCL